MSVKVIVDKASRAVLVLDPPTRMVVDEVSESGEIVTWHDEVILPEGLDCEVVDLPDTEAAKFGPAPEMQVATEPEVIKITAGQFTISEDGTVRG